MPSGRLSSLGVGELLDRVKRCRSSTGRRAAPRSRTTSSDSTRRPSRRTGDGRCRARPPSLSVAKGRAWRRTAIADGPPVAGDHTGRSARFSRTRFAGQLRTEARCGDRHRGARGVAAGAPSVRNSLHQPTPARCGAVDAWLDGRATPRCDPGRRTTSEASTRLRAVADGCPIAASSGSLSTVAGKRVIWTGRRPQHVGGSMTWVSSAGNSLDERARSMRQGRQPRGAGAERSDAPCRR